MTSRSTHHPLRAAQQYTGGGRREITLSELRALRLRAQCLAPRWPRHGLVEVVHALCGVNAQLPSAMALSLRARVAGLTIQDVETSRVQHRDLVRTWCMRGTMHLLAADDVDWLLSAIAPSAIRGGWNWLARRGGLERSRAEKVLNAAYKILRTKGPVTRRELMAAVAAKHGEAVTTAAAGVVHLSGLLGRLCFGPNHGAEPTLVALDQWLGRPIKLSEKPDHLRLARRYLKGYGPATPRDFAAWWGLPLTLAKTAWSLLREELTELQIAGQSVWLLASELPAPTDGTHASHTVRLLPAFDTYLLGYRDRAWVVPAPYQGRVFHGGEIVPTIIVDGCAAGTWRYEQRGKQISIRATSFSSFSKPIRELIAQEAGDIGRFFGRAVDLRFTKDDN